MLQFNATSSKKFVAGYRENHKGAVVTTVLFIALGFFSGSIPTAYMASHWRKGIDLRRFGSGTVSGSMVYEHVSHWMVVPVGLIDIAKSAFPCWLALISGLSLLEVILVGLAAVIGHNWPIFLGFTGGRGLSPFLGILLVIFPGGFVWLLIFLAIGFLLGDSAPWALASLVCMPVLVEWLDAPPAIYAGILGMLIITGLKRLEANQRPLPEDKNERRKVLWRRLIFDRDIADHKDWINRKPDQDSKTRNN
jgi:glycerol-3-phosphate acyltransferase PlsY